MPRIKFKTWLEFSTTEKIFRVDAVPSIEFKLYQVGVEQSLREQWKQFYC